MKGEHKSRISASTGKTQVSDGKATVSTCNDFLAWPYHLCEVSHLFEYQNKTGDNFPTIVSPVKMYPAWMSQEVSKRLGAVGYNPNKNPIYKWVK